jgi:hypothetical protein
VAGKIDRAEVDHLQSLVAKVLLYDAFKADTIEALKRLHKFRDDSLVRDEGFDGYLAALDAELKEAQSVLSRTATKKDTHQLAHELQDLERRLQEYAKNDALSEVRSISCALIFSRQLSALFRSWHFRFEMLECERMND